MTLIFMIKESIEEQAIACGIKYAVQTASTKTEK